jgi:hypothetical protein
MSEHAEINAWISETAGEHSTYGVAELTDLARRYPDIGLLRWIETAWATGYRMDADELAAMYLRR